MRVGVLRGGIGHEYDVSLQTGGAVLNAMPDSCIGYDILITRDGTWHHQGLPVTPEQVSKRVDVFFNALHGEYGEDGQVQKILEHHNVPYTGSGHYPCAIAMNKPLAKEAVAKAGIKVARHIVIQPEDDSIEATRVIFTTMCPPWIIKPVAAGSSVGLLLARNFDQIRAGIEHARQFANQIMVEEFIRGMEVTSGVIDHFRGAQHYALLPVEIRKDSAKVLYDYSAKYQDDGVSLVCPGALMPAQTQTICEAAVTVHQALGLRHYSRSDFILSPRGLYFLEVNTLPGLTEHSNIPRSLKAIGASLKQFVGHVIDLAVKH